MWNASKGTWHIVSSQKHCSFYSFHPPWPTSGQQPPSWFESLTRKPTPHRTVKVSWEKMLSLTLSRACINISRLPTAYRIRPGGTANAQRPRWLTILDFSGLISSPPLLNILCANKTTYTMLLFLCFYSLWIHHALCLAMFIPSTMNTLSFPPYLTNNSSFKPQIWSLLWIPKKNWSKQPFSVPIAPYQHFLLSVFMTRRL